MIFRFLCVSAFLNVSQHDGDALFHEREPFFVVVADAEILGLVFEIVLQHHADVGVVVGAVLRHQVENFIGNVSAVLDGGAAGERRRLGRFRRVRVHHASAVPATSLRRTPPEAAHRVMVCVAAFANALRREELDQVGALLLALPYQFAQLSRHRRWSRSSAAAKSERAAREDSARDRVAQILVDQRARDSGRW